MGSSIVNDADYEALGDTVFGLGSATGFVNGLACAAGWKRLWVGIRSLVGACCMSFVLAAIVGRLLHGYGHQQTGGLVLALYLWGCAGLCWLLMLFAAGRDRGPVRM